MVRTNDYHQFTEFFQTMQALDFESEIRPDCQPKPKIRSQTPNFDVPQRSRLKRPVAAQSVRSRRFPNSQSSN